MTVEQSREYKVRMEEFRRKLTELLEDYHVHIYVDDEEDMYINTSVLGMYSEGEFDFDYVQPIKDNQ